MFRLVVCNSGGRHLSGLLDFVDFELYFHSCLRGTLVQMQGALSTQLPFTLCSQLLYMMTFVDEAAVAAEGGFVCQSISSLFTFDILYLVMIVDSVMCW